MINLIHLHIHFIDYDGWFLVCLVFFYYFTFFGRPLIPAYN